jgi:hypothetical protein
MRPSVLEPSQMPRYARLTYPALRHLLTGDQAAMAVAVGVASGAEPIGLALGWPGRRQYDVLSLYCTTAALGIDLRPALLRRLMQCFAERGMTVGVSHPTCRAGDPGLIQAFRDCGWKGPALRQVTAHSTVDRMLGLPFARRGELRRGYAVIPWREIGAERAAVLATAVAALPDQIRTSIDPFAFEGRADPTFSSALLYRGVVVGWHLPERLKDDLMRWTCSAILPRHAALAAVLQNWLAALRVQQAHGIAGLTFGAPASHPAMQRFIVQRLRPALLQLNYGLTFILGYRH